VSDFAVIPARGKSKGMRRKNLRSLGGIPLIAHSIVSAAESGLFDEIHVSTEDEEIAKVAEDFGAVVIERPVELAGDITPMPPVIEHAVSWYERRYGPPTRIFVLQPTSPFRSSGDIREASALLRDDADSVMAVFEPADPPQWALRATGSGYLEPNASLAEYMSRRQDLMRTYFDGPLYAIEARAFDKHKRFLTERTSFFVVPAERAIDIDTEDDFRFAEFLLATR
jgi:CMP-N,N'-diacetyllegionaminic acid synthase